MNFQITINTDNASFAEDMRGELQHLVNASVDEFMNSYLVVQDDEHASASLIEGNGNKCGCVRTFGNRAKYNQSQG